jgi:hypothetical protein
VANTNMSLLRYDPLVERVSTSETSVKFYYTVHEAISQKTVSSDDPKVSHGFSQSVQTNACLVEDVPRNSEPTY